MRRKKDKTKPNDIIFGTTIQAELDEVIYGFLNCRLTNNMVIPPCFRHSKKGGQFSEEFASYLSKKYNNEETENGNTRK